MAAIESTAGAQSSVTARDSFVVLRPIAVVAAYFSGGVLTYGPRPLCIAVRCNRLFGDGSTSKWNAVGNPKPLCPNLYRP